MDTTTLAIIFGAVIAVLVVTHEAYRLGKEDGWLEGADWAAREFHLGYTYDGYTVDRITDVPPLSPEFIAAKRGSRYVSDGSFGDPAIGGPNGQPEYIDVQRD